MHFPAHISNVPQWEEHCRMIRARALDVIEGKLGVIEAARTLSKLAYWAGLREDADLLTFEAIDSETDTLPLGDVRKLWAEHALLGQDVEIARAEEMYKATAVEAASRLVERFAWTLEARKARRDAGHAV